MKGKLGIKLRRITAKELLEKQLKSGVKPEKVKGKMTNSFVDLSDFDKKRMEKELAVLSKHLNK